MSQRKPLLSVDYHTDDETGMYHVGEIDFGIHGELTGYLQRYGYKGATDVISTLAHLIYEVENTWRNIKVEEPAQQESSGEPTPTYQTSGAGIIKNKSSITLNPEWHGFGTK